MKFFVYNIHLVIVISFSGRYWISDDYSFGFNRFEFVTNEFLLCPFQTMQAVYNGKVEFNPPFSIFGCNVLSSQHNMFVHWTFFVSVFQSFHPKISVTSVSEGKKKKQNKTHTVQNLHFILIFFTFAHSAFFIEILHQTEHNLNNLKYFFFRIPFFQN